MLSVKNNLIGRQFDAWSVIGAPERCRAKIYYLCRCKCGTEKRVESYNLTSGRSKACRKCSAKRVGVLIANGNPSHWLYSKWQGIKSRCYNEREASYRHYGAKGVTLHEPWRRDFAMFQRYVERVLGLPLNPYMTLDRIDNARGYEPCNLRWATRAEQSANRTPSSKWSFLRKAMRRLP